MSDEQETTEAVDPAPAAEAESTPEAPASEGAECTCGDAKEPEKGNDAVDPVADTPGEETPVEGAGQAEEATPDVNPEPEPASV